LFDHVALSLQVSSVGHFARRENFEFLLEREREREMEKDKRCVLIKRLKRVYNVGLVKFRILSYADGRMKVRAEKNDNSFVVSKTFSSQEVRSRLTHLSYTWMASKTKRDNAVVKAICSKRGKDMLKLLEADENGIRFIKKREEEEEEREKEEKTTEKSDDERFSPPSPPRLRKSISMVEDQLEMELTPPITMSRSRSAPSLSATKRVVEDAYEIIEKQKPIRTVLRMEQLQDMGQVRKGRRASRGSKSMTPKPKTMLRKTRSRLLTPMTTDDEMLSSISLNSTMSLCDSPVPKPSFCRKMSFGEEVENEDLQKEVESPDAKHLNFDHCQYPRPIRRSQSYASKLRSRIELSKDYVLPSPLQPILSQNKKNISCSKNPKQDAIVALLGAARRNKLNKGREVLKSLKSLGLELSSIDSCCDKHGNTALILASQSGHFDFCQFLIEAGHRLDDTNERGNTALHYCYAYGHANIANMLLQEGASDNIVNAVGSDCYDGAL